MFNLSSLAIGATLVALVLTLVLAAWLTPARWWRRPNLRALSIVAAGTWGIASLILWLAQAPPTWGAPALASDAGRSYLVYDDLNLRANKGTAAPRIAVVPAGTLVTSTGVRDGDWWQVSARVGGKEVRGWSSSLWLRRADEKAM